MEVSVRELNERLTGYLRRAHNGERVVVTRHGKAFVEIGPPQEVSTSGDETLGDRLRVLPGVTWTGNRLCGISKPVPLHGKGPNIAEMIVQSRG